jgi:hypothetical protein
VACVNDALDFLLDLAAIGAGVNAAFEFENGDALALRFVEMQNHGNSVAKKIDRVKGYSPS